MMALARVRPLASRSYPLRPAPDFCFSVPSCCLAVNLFCLLSPPAHPGGSEWVEFTGSKRAEIDARRAIEDHCGLLVHDANIILQGNCPNVDLVVFGKAAPVYVQVKLSSNPASKDCVVASGSPWTHAQLFEGAPIFNRHDDYRASLIIIVDRKRDGETDYYVIPPGDLEALLVPRSRTIADKPKRDGARRSIGFRKEVPREELTPWRNAWHLLSAPQLSSSSSEGGA